MALADAVEGSVRGGQIFTVGVDDGKGGLTPTDVTGSTITGSMRAIDQNTPTRAMDSTFMPIGTTGQPDQGDVRWDYAATDLIPGTHNLVFTFTFSAGATPLKTFRARWYVASGDP